MSFDDEIDYEKILECNCAADILDSFPLKRDHVNDLERWYNIIDAIFLYYLQNKKVDLTKCTANEYELFYEDLVLFMDISINRLCCNTIEYILNEYNKIFFCGQVHYHPDFEEEGYGCKDIKQMMEDTRFVSYRFVNDIENENEIENEITKSKKTKIINIFLDHGFATEILELFANTVEHCREFWNLIINDINLHLMDINYVYPNTRVSLLSFVIYNKSHYDHTKFTNILNALLNHPNIDINKRGDLFVDDFIARLSNDDIILSDWTPLFTAIWIGDTQLVVKLLKMGADLNVECGKYSYTPLMMAIRKFANFGPREIINLLLNKKYKIDINKQNKYGETALMIASVYDEPLFMGQYSGIIDLLIHYRANINMKTLKNHTALTYAMSSTSDDKYENIIKLLKYFPTVFPDEEMIKRIETKITKKLCDDIRTLKLLHEILPLPIAEEIVQYYELDNYDRKLFS